MKRFLLSFAALASASFVAAPAVNASLIDQAKCRQAMIESIQEASAETGYQPKTTYRDVYEACQVIDLLIRKGYPARQAFIKVMQALPD